MVGFEWCFEEANLKQHVRDSVDYTMNGVFSSKRSFPELPHIDFSSLLYVVTDEEV